MSEFLKKSVSLQELIAAVDRALDSRSREWTNNFSIHSIS
jgi:hypothetical protein